MPWCLFKNKITQNALITDYQNTKPSIILCHCDRQNINLYISTIGRLYPLPEDLFKYVGLYCYVAVVIIDMHP